jgi:hypothetical protein
MKKYLLAVALTIAASAAGAKGTVYLRDFVPQNMEVKDYTPIFRAALDRCRAVKATKLVIGEGTYPLRPDRAYERYCYVSNNDEGLKRILFDLAGMTDFEIDGAGARLLFTGYISPVLVNNSSNITLRNFSVDYTRTFHSEATIERVSDGWIDVRFGEQFGYSVDDGTLNFRDAEGTRYPSSNMLEFDAVRREPAYRASDYWIFSRIVARQNDDGSVRVFKEKLTATPGNIMIFGAGRRINPAITVSDSRGVTISDVTVYHAGGMGVIGQRSSDIELRGVKITPPEGRMVSASADATHFVNCGGYLRMIDCLFENQKDDATNIHGIYARIVAVDGDRITVKLMHPQQQGFDFIGKGATLEFADCESLITYAERKVKSTVRLNKEYTEFTLEGGLPEGIKLNDPVAQIDVKPEVLISGCRIQNNRARGLLIGGRGKIVIENNYFHTAGTAILFEGDGNYWFEQAGVRDLTVRNNLFENCLYGYLNWGDAVISTKPGLYRDKERSRYNRNITVENNTFRGFDPRLINIFCVDGFTFRNNRVETTSAYPADKADSQPIVTQWCDNLTIIQ